jgi:hypothetical protein
MKWSVPQVIIAQPRKFLRVLVAPLRVLKRPLGE